MVPLSLQGRGRTEIRTSVELDEEKAIGEVGKGDRKRGK